MLESKKYLVKEIKGKSQAKMFKNLKVGHSIAFTLPIKHAYASRGVGASYVTVTNLDNGDTTSKSMNELLNLLNYFVLEEVQ